MCVFFQRFNADYELSARQGADTMAYIALLQEKLQPALVAPSLSCLFTDKYQSVSTVIIQVDDSTSHSYTLSGWTQKTTPVWRAHGLLHARRSHLTLLSLVGVPVLPSPASFWPKERHHYTESPRWRERSILICLILRSHDVSTCLLYVVVESAVFCYSHCKSLLLSVSDLQWR